jgi:cyclophilin family peptidyl-prolyl cis-trans isomerase
MIQTGTLKELVLVVLDMHSKMNSRLKFDKAGVLAMANSGPATNSSQFSLPQRHSLAKRKTHYFWACNRRNGYRKQYLKVM